MGDSRFRNAFNPSRFLDAKLALLPIDRRPFHCHVRIAGGMKRDGVRSVGGILGALQPVAKLFAAADDAASVTSNQQVIAGQRPRGCRADVREHKASRLPGMISRMLNTILEGAVFRLGGLLQTFAAPVIEPTVVTAPDAVVLDTAELKRRAAMGAVEF